MAEDTQKKEAEGTAEATEKVSESTAPETSAEADKPAEAPATDAEPAEEAADEAANPAEEDASESEPADEKPLEEAYRWIKPGMIVKVHLKIKETTPKGEERERIQVFEGTVIARKGRSPETATITVRKVSGGIGVERIFPLQMPTIDKIELVKQMRVRRSKIYFIRDSRKKKLKEVEAKK